MFTRTLEVIKEVSRRYVVLKIPFPSMAVKDLTVESWTKKGNELHLLLSREVPAETPPTLIEKGNWEARYPGERS